MNFAERIAASVTAESSNQPQWVSVKPYEYDLEGKRAVILVNPQDPFASSTSNLVFAVFTGNTLDFGVKWFIGGQDDTLSIKYADGLDIDQVNHFFNKHGVPTPITVAEVCYLLTGIEDEVPEGPGGAPVEQPQPPTQHQEQVPEEATPTEPMATQGPGPGMPQPPSINGEPAANPQPPAQPKIKVRVPTFKEIPVGHA